MRLPFGLFIEHDLAFESTTPLSVWADTARRAGSILWAETLLRRAAQGGLTPGADPDLPLSGEPDGG